MTKQSYRSSRILYTCIPLLCFCGSPVLYHTKTLIWLLLMKPFQGLRKPVLWDFPLCLPNETAGKASKTRGLQCELQEFCIGRGFVTHGEGFRKALGKIFDVGRIKFWRMEKKLYLLLCWAQCLGKHYKLELGLQVVTRGQFCRSYLCSQAVGLFISQSWLVKVLTTNLLDLTIHSSEKTTQTY